MIKKLDKNAVRQRRHIRVRKKVIGTSERPRLNVYRSTANIYAQIIDDSVGNTLVSASTLDKAIKAECEYGGNIEAANILANYAKYMYGSDFEGKLKKDDIIHICLNDMGCADYSKAVYIGDGKSDGKGANTVGINFIAVTYGFGFKKIEDAAEYNPIGVTNTCDGIRSIIMG